MDARLPTRRLLAGLAIMALLAGCAGGAAVAPSPTPAATTSPAAPTAASTASPAASPTPAATPATTSVIGTATCPTVDVGVVTSGSGGVRHIWGNTISCTVTTTDPRVTGTERMSPWNVDQWGTASPLGIGGLWGSGDSGARVQWGSVRLDNAGGAWEGTGSGVSSSDRGDILVSWYKGTGGYAGLGYFELRTGKAPHTIRGLIFPGDPPDLTGEASVTGPVLSPNVPAPGSPTPAPAPTASAIAYGPVSVTEGTSEYTYVDIGTGTYAGSEAVNDPRVSGTFFAPNWILDTWGATSDSLGAGTQWGGSRLETAGGTWTGVASGILDEGGDVIAIWNKGSGAYAGLTYFELLARPDLFGTLPGATTSGVFGQVFPGDPPTP